MTTAPRVPRRVPYLLEAWAVSCAAGLAMQASARVQVFTIKCLQCGRSAGQLVAGHFVTNRYARSPTMEGRSARCGECGGNLYTELDESVSYAEAARWIG